MRMNLFISYIHFGKIINNMTKEEFIKDVVTISKYNGDIASYINDNLENVEIPFTLNDSFTGILTKEGEDGYMSDKVGQKVRLQFHNLTELSLLVL